uniref:Uncharacterized protein n=1 Tax=Picea glauca TaxID=3330 RepID=A0A101LZJ2_PICGL|nr:hypothetical protein ABT39_MTgene5161 [Picea glauca]
MHLGFPLAARLLVGGGERRRQRWVGGSYCCLVSEATRFNSISFLPYSIISEGNGLLIKADDYQADFTRPLSILCLE